MSIVCTTNVVISIIVVIMTMTMPRNISTWQMWTNFRFLHMTDVENSEITPHVEKLRIWGMHLMLVLIMLTFYFPNQIVNPFHHLVRPAESISVKKVKLLIFISSIWIRTLDVCYAFMRVFKDKWPLSPFFTEVCLFICLLKELGSEQVKSHWLHLFDFSPLCVFKCVLKWCA